MSLIKQFIYRIKTERDSRPLINVVKIDVDRIMAATSGKKCLADSRLSSMRIVMVAIALLTTCVGFIVLLYLF